MNAVATFERNRDDRLRVWDIASHDPCLLSFQCEKLPEASQISDNRLRLKGFLNFLDAFVDPSAGTQYVICTHAPNPLPLGNYFEQVGRRMAWIMQSPEGQKSVRQKRRVARRV